MARPRKSQEMRRLNLAVSKKVHQRLVKLRDATSADSVTEVIRNAIAVYDHLMAEREKGGEVFIESESDRQRVLLVP